MAARACRALPAPRRRVHGQLEDRAPLPQSGIRRPALLRLGGHVFGAGGVAGAQPRIHDQREQARIVIDPDERRLPRAGRLLIASAERVARAEEHGGGQEVRVGAQRVAKPLRGPLEVGAPAPAPRDRPPVRVVRPNRPARTGTPPWPRRHSRATRPARRAGRRGHGQSPDARRRSGRGWTACPGRA